MAGVLGALGYHVPRPVLRPNASNPLGFFEPRWSVRFHKRILARRFVRQTDGRPEAFDLVADAVTPADRVRLGTWLERAFEASDRVVVKDPRIIWTVPLWSEAAAAIGASATFVLMVRRPSEVVASRLTWYGSPSSDTAAWTLRVRNLAAWINANLGAERRTRDRPRTIVTYDDLVADWRAAVERLVRETRIDVDPDRLGAARAIDALVRPELNRHRVTWDGMDLPDELIRIADEVWAAMGALAAGRDAGAPAAGGGDRMSTAEREVAMRRLDAAADDFAERMRVARAIASDAISARLRSARAAADREARRPPRHRRLVARLLARLPPPIRAIARPRPRGTPLSR